MNELELGRTMMPSLLAGTARQPLPEEAKVLGVLAALSLTGQMLRFAAPEAPTSFAIEPVIEDGRRMLPDAVRGLMLRLLGGKTATDHPATAVARILDERQLRPHPFDLPKLDSFVRAHAERLGATAQHWARRSAEKTETNTFYDGDLLDDQTWSQGTTSRRALYLAKRRTQDAEAARALLQAVWARESAEARFRFLQVFYRELSADDIEFLQSLDKDRALRVRSLARRMLAKLGDSTDNTALNTAMGRLKRTEAGFLRRRTVLALELPANVKEQAAPAWIHNTFGDISLEELARNLGIRELDMVEAAAEDANLLLGLALMATLDGRLDVLEAVVKHLPNAWQLLSDAELTDMGIMPEEERRRWAEILIRPYGLKLPWDYPAWSWLHAMLDGPAPPLLLESAFRSEWFTEEPTMAKHTAYWMELTAALCPPPQRSELRCRLDRFDAALTTTAMMLLDLLEALEEEKQHA